MGNQSAVLKFKNEIESNSDMISSSNLSEFKNNPLFITIQRNSNSYHSSDKKPKDFFDEINDTIPINFNWTGKVNKSIYISGSFNDWKIKVPLSKCENESYYVIINCTPGTYAYKFFVDDEWYHDPSQPFVKNIYDTYDNIIEVKKSNSAMETLLPDENFSFPYNQPSSSNSTEMRRNSSPGDYGQIIPRPTISDYDIFPMQFPSYLNESILDAAVYGDQEPSLLPNPNHVQLNHMYSSSIKDGLFCLSVTVRYRSKFTTMILYKSIPI